MKEGERPRGCGLLLCLRARMSYIVREGENGFDHAHLGRYGLGGYLLHRASVRAASGTLHRAPVRAGVAEEGCKRRAGGRGEVV